LVWHDSDSGNYSLNSQKFLALIRIKYSSQIFSTHSLVHTVLNHLPSPFVSTKEGKSAGDESAEDDERQQRMRLVNQRNCDNNNTEQVAIN